MMQNSALKARAEPATHSFADVAFDPHDLMITIDPFDWIYLPLCSRLLKEKNHVFFIPMGIRSLVCLLRGIALPTDEVSEFEQQMRVSSTTRRHRKLPSIFAFPIHEDGGEYHKTSQLKRRSLCCKDNATGSQQPEIRALWSLVLDDNSKIHLALRSLIALGINLPQPSLEYNSLLREGDDIRRSLRKYSLLPPSNHKLENVLSSLNAGRGSTRTDLLPFQRLATKKFALARIATAALSLFAEDKSTQIAATSKEQVSTGGRRTLSPISQKCDCAKKQEALCIRQRLSDASEAARVEVERRKDHYRSSGLERYRQRLAIRKACDDVERLRSHLVSSLGILCIGRQHPDPQQSFAEWIKSLPTLETLQLERQQQQEMRQRQILEQQYQREAQRRHERDECNIMHGNDYNVPEENEVSIRQQKHKQFLRMQAEMRQLEQRGTADSTVNRTEEMKEKRAAQERQRLLQLDDQRRERRESEKMSREDLYYVERILRAKAKAKEEQGKRERRADHQKNAIEEQQRRIARMRLLDEEKRLAERESSGMRLEDLLGRQIRLREAEKAKEVLHNEWRERKTMQAEEHDCRSRWILWERALIKQQQEELKQQRAEARRRKRHQQREERELRDAWTETWDNDGNKVFYNSITGTSQWEVPDQL
ncbi:putative WW domain-containing protein [Phytophthora infestans]|uniref:Putative WW domain-containing protein n=1 Tax=Phytophthora infestans TaxID=4787 RepID=A0A833SYF9_PHYIN|nr:putative WW domain-containing protein [Phytophthora infestans]